MKTANAAKLPALPSVSTGNPALDKWIQAATEHLEVREGSRGNPNERAVTVRELKDMVFSGWGGGSVGSVGSTGNVLAVNPDGTYSAMTPDQFSESIRSSKLYKDLMRRLDDVSRFDGLPEQVKAVLLQSIAEEAAKRGAEIRRLDFKIQNTSESLAYTVQEVTAAVQGSVAGVREMTFASATANNATAGKVTQLTAALDGTGSATIEESLIVIADRTEGLRAQAMLKLNAGNAVTGYGLMASEDPSGATESKFIVQADQFALTGTYTYMQGDASSTPPVTPPSAAVAGETWYNTRTNLSYRAAGGTWNAYTQPIPFGVDMTTNTTYINGSLRVTGSSGTTLDELAAGASGTSAGIAYAYKRSATDLIAGWAPTTNGPGAVTWTFSSGSITTPATDALLNGWTKAIPSGTDPLYVTVCSAAATSATDSIADTEWATPALLTQNGSNGLNVATAILYQRNSSATVGPTAQANTVTFTFSNGGMSGMSAGWTTAIPASSSGAYLWVTRATASATTPTDTLAAGEWSAPVLYTQDGVDGSPGTAVYTGTVYKQAASATAPSGGNFNAATATLTAPSGWTITQPTTTTVPTWASEYTFNVVAGSTTNTGGTWSTPYIDAVKGADGSTQMRLELYLSAASTPTQPTSVLYTVTGNALSTQTGGTAGWSTSKPANPVYTSAVYMTTAIVSTPTPGTQLSVTSWTAPVIVAQSGAPGGAGARGTIVTKITGAWNATTAAAAVTAIATAAGSTPTTPIKGDIVYYTGGAQECTVAGSPGTWGAVAAYIDGSLVVTGTISGTQIAATAIDGKTITGATIQTAAAVPRVRMTTSLLEAVDASSNSVTINPSTGGYGININYPNAAQSALNVTSGSILYPAINAAGAQRGVAGSSSTSTKNNGLAGVYAANSGGGDALNVAGTTTATGPIKITQATGTKPLDVTSTTVCTNLNAEMWNGMKVSVATNGSGTPTLAANKPTAGSAGQSNWLRLDIGGSFYYIPAWV